IVGRRKMMLGAYAWFSLGMAATAFTHSSITFGLFRFVTGLGVGVLLATTAALVSEFAPKGKKNLCNAITYSGVPLGSLAAAALAIVLVEQIGWRGLFLIGALPFVTLLPLAFWMMLESVAWLASRGHTEEARTVAAKTGVEVPGATGAELVEERGAAGYRGLFGDFLIPAILIGLMSATGLLLVYSLDPAHPDRGGVDPAELQAYFVMSGRYTAGVATHYPSQTYLTASGTHQPLAKGLTIGMRFHSAPVVRLADAKPVQLGHAARADGAWRLYAFADGSGEKLRALMIFLAESDRSPVKRYTPAGANIDSVIDVRAIFQQCHRDLK